MGGDLYFRYVQSGLRSALHARITRTRIDFRRFPNKNKDAIVLSGCWRSPAVTETETLLISACAGSALPWLLLLNNSACQKYKTETRKSRPRSRYSFFPLRVQKLEATWSQQRAFWPRSIVAPSLPASLLLRRGNTFHRGRMQRERQARDSQNIPRGRRLLLSNTVKKVQREDLVAANS